jgi:hypothetical protein
MDMSKDVPSMVIDLQITSDMSKADSTHTGSTANVEDTLMEVMEDDKSATTTAGSGPVKEEMDSSSDSPFQSGRSMQRDLEDIDDILQDCGEGEPKFGDTHPESLPDDDDEYINAMIEDLDSDE